MSAFHQLHQRATLLPAWAEVGSRRQVERSPGWGSRTPGGPVGPGHSREAERALTHPRRHAVHEHVEQRTLVAVAWQQGVDPASPSHLWAGPDELGQARLRRIGTHLEHAALAVDEEA